MASPDTELLASVAELDPQIRKRVLRLANKALDKAEFLMEHGDPKTQQMVIKEYLKIFGKHMEVTKGNDEVELLRQSLMELRQAVMTRMPDALPAAPEEDNGTDAGEIVVMDGPIRITR